MGIADDELLLTLARPAEFKRRRRRRQRLILPYLLLLLIVQLLAVVPLAQSRSLQPASSSAYALGRQRSAAETETITAATTTIATATAFATTTTTTSTTTTTTTASTSTTRSHFVGNDRQPRIETTRLRRGTANDDHEQPQSSAAALDDQGGGGGANKTNSSHQQEAALFQQRMARLKQKYISNRAINDTAYYILLFVYSGLILFGTVSNSLICLTVILKPQVLSPRNIFIINLACSDLLLCVFTMPFSFIEISMKMWHMGESNTSTSEPAIDRTNERID